MRRVQLLVVTAILARSLAASADPSSTAPQIPDSGVAGAGSFVEGDAAAGRAYLGPTAFTNPAGTAGIVSWFPGLPIVGVAAVTYGITDRIELGAGVTYSATDHIFTANYLEARGQLLRRARTAIAIEWQHMAPPDASGDAVDVLTVVGSRVLGRAVVSASVSAIPDHGTLHVVGDGSIIWGGKLKLVGEGLLFQDGDRTLVMYGGARYATHRISADLGFAFAKRPGESPDVAPFPFAAISARF
jgi:hypothetical protein